MGVYVEKEFRIKRAKLEKSPYVRLIKSSKSAFNHKAKSGNRNQKSPSREVTFKITGSGKTAKGIKNGIDYITRNGELEAYNFDPVSGDEHGKGKDFNKYATENLSSDNDYDKKYKGQNIDHVKNMVFSAPPHLKVSKEDMLSSFQKMMNEKYPNNAYVAVYHEDKKEHPHLHVNLKLMDKTGKRIRLTKEVTQNFRKDFTKNLQDLGHDVSCTFKKEQYREQQRALKLENETQPEKMRNVYKVKDFGTTNYNNDPKNKRTGFITYETLKNKKEVTIWAKGLEEKCIDEQIKVGSLVRLKKLENTIVKTPIYDKLGRQIDLRESKQSNWSVENIALNRDRNYKVEKEKINVRTSEQQNKTMLEHRKKIEIQRNLHKGKNLDHKRKGNDLGY